MIYLRLLRPTDRSQCLLRIGLRSSNYIVRPALSISSAENDANYYMLRTFTSPFPSDYGTSIIFVIPLIYCEVLSDVEPLMRFYLHVMHFI